MNCSPEQYMNEIPSSNPCLSCGACCISYRASFYWGECDDHPDGTVPHELTEKLNDFLVVMRGTNRPNPRCIALEGIIGNCVHCSIYEKRASVCREFEVSWAYGTRNERCDACRETIGLLPLAQPVQPQPSPFPSPDVFPHAA